MCPACGAPVKQVPVQPGGKIQFGGYDWFVPDKQDDKTLIITEKIIEKRAYTKSKNCLKHSDGDAFYAHAEIAVNEQTVLAISETAHYDTEFTKGNTMRFGLSFDGEESLYRLLK